MVSSEGTIAHPKGAYRTCQTSLSLWSIRNIHHSCPQLPRGHGGGSGAAKAQAFGRGASIRVRLNVEPSARAQQPIAVGVDPGSKREGIVVASANHIYANIQAVARKMERRVSEQTPPCKRRIRRNRKTPAANRARTANTAKRGCRPPPRPAGSGNCTWPPFSASYFP